MKPKATVSSKSKPKQSCAKPAPTPRAINSAPETPPKTVPKARTKKVAYASLLAYQSMTGRFAAAAKGAAAGRGRAHARGKTAVVPPETAGDDTEEDDAEVEPAADQEGDSKKPVTQTVGNKRKAESHAAKPNASTKKAKTTESKAGSVEDLNKDWPSVKASKWALAFINFFLYPTIDRSETPQAWKSVSTSLWTEFQLRVTSRSLSKWASEFKKDKEEALRKWVDQKLGNGWDDANRIEHSAERVVAFVRADCKPVCDVNSSAFHFRTLAAREMQALSTRALARATLIGALAQCNTTTAFDAIAEDAVNVGIGKALVNQLRKGIDKSRKGYDGFNSSFGSHESPVEDKDEGDDRSAKPTSPGHEADADEPHAAVPQVPASASASASGSEQQGGKAAAMAAKAAALSKARV